MFGSNGMMDLLVKSLATPRTSGMIAGKISEMYGMLAEEFNCKIKDVGLFLKLEDLPVKVKAEEGNKSLPAQGSQSEVTNNGQTPPTSVVTMQQKTELKAIIYVMVNGKAVQTIPVEEFLAMATKGAK